MPSGTQERVLWGASLTGPRAVVSSVRFEEGLAGPLVLGLRAVTFLDVAATRTLLRAHEHSRDQAS